MKAVCIKQSGFSIVELMISLVAGLIVIGAVGTFLLSSFRSNSEFIAATRLTQDLRNANDFIGRELRRAGYDQSALDYLAVPTSVTKKTSDFSPLLINRDRNSDGVLNDACTIYAYDRTPGDPGLVNLNNGEIRAIRRIVTNNVGVIEVAQSAASLTPTCAGATADYAVYPPACNTSSGWCALTDPKIVNISEFSIDDTGVIDLPGSTGVNPLQVRDLFVRVRGNLIADTAVARVVQSRVRVRADCLKATASCDVAPAQTASN